VNDYTIELDALVLDTDVIEVPEHMLRVEGPRGYRGREGSDGQRGKDGDSVKGEPGHDGNSVDPARGQADDDTGTRYKKRSRRSRA
jgi:hypothetical protein